MRLNPSSPITTMLKPMLLMRAVSKYCGIILVLSSVALGSCTAPSSGPSESGPSEPSATETDSALDKDSGDSGEAIASSDPLESTDTKSTETKSTETETEGDRTPADESETPPDEPSQNVVVEEGDRPDETAAIEVTPESDSNATKSDGESDVSSLFIAADHLDSFLYQYYDLINQRQYQQAWSRLGPEMQANSSYDSYVEWWGSIRRVDVQSINHLYAAESGGEVMVLLSYDQGTKGIEKEVLAMSIGHLPSDLKPSAEDTSTDDWVIRSVAVAQSISPTQTQDANPITPTSSLVIDGIGPIQVGMTVQEAANATGFPIATRGVYDSDACDYYEPIGAPSGISFMVSYDRIVRVDIDTDAIKTPSGAGIGSSADEIKALYPGKIEESGHPYVAGGQYLRFVPTDAADQAYRILFETDENGKVTRFRSGFVEEVGYVEGCS